jgi:Flp pilus assembly protein TadG
MRLNAIMDCLAARLIIGTRERLAALAKACDGTTAVETALVLPAFLLLLFAIIEAGFLFWTQTTLQSAVEAAARCAVVNSTLCGTTSAIQTYAASQAVGMTISSSSFSVSTTSPGCSYQVSISYPFNLILTRLFSTSSITLNAKSCHP